MITQNPVFGRMRQKMGGVVASTWKGINVLKTKPLTVANPRSAGQLMRRSALTQIVALFRFVSSAVNVGFREQAVGKSPYNAFAGKNLRDAFDYSAPPVATIQYADLLFAQGTISPTAIDTIVADVSLATIVVGWVVGTLQPGQSNADLSNCVFVNETTGDVFPLPGAGVRTGGSLQCTITDLPFTAGDVINAYLFFSNTVSRKASDSRFDTVVAIA